MTFGFHSHMMGSDRFSLTFGLRVRVQDGILAFIYGIYQAIYWNFYVATRNHFLSNNYFYFAFNESK